MLCWHNHPLCTVLPPLLCWHPRPHCAVLPSFTALSTTWSMALFRHCCPCSTGIIICAGIIALVALALSPSLCWCCCPHHSDVVAIVVMLPLTSSRWHLCCHCSVLFTVIELVLCAGTVTLITHPHYAGIVAPPAKAPGLSIE